MYRTPTDINNLIPKENNITKEKIIHKVLMYLLSKRNHMFRPKGFKEVGINLIQLELSCR